MGLTRTRIRVEGIVQGVGFRPFVHALATRLGLAGVVGNDARGVFVEVEGDPDRIEAEPVPPTGEPGFTIAPSAPDGERQALVAPDTATCPDCLRELFDPAD